MPQNGMEGRLMCQRRLDAFWTARYPVDDRTKAEPKDRAGGTIPRPTKVCNGEQYEYVLFPGVVQYTPLGCCSSRLGHRHHIDRRLGTMIVDRAGVLPEAGALEKRSEGEDFVAEDPGESPIPLRLARMATIDISNH